MPPARFWELREDPFRNAARRVPQHKVGGDWEGVHVSAGLAMMMSVTVRLTLGVLVSRSRGCWELIFFAIRCSGASQLVVDRRHSTRNRGIGWHNPQWLTRVVTGPADDPFCS
jgi:hypothetical protein